MVQNMFPYNSSLFSHAFFENIRERVPEQKKMFFSESQLIWRHNTETTVNKVLFLIKCLLLPLYYFLYTRMCNKSQISNPFSPLKNGKACLLV